MSTLKTDKKEKIENMEKDLSKVIDRNMLTREEVLNSYKAVIWAIELTDEIDSELAEIIKNTLIENQIAVENVLNFFDEFFEIEALVLKIENCNFLNSSEKLTVKKFLHKTEIWKLNLKFLWADKEEKVYDISNNDEEYINKFKKIIENFLFTRTFTNDLLLSVWFNSQKN